MRIFERSIFNGVAKTVSGIGICKANAPTASPMDFATEVDEMGPTLNSLSPRWDTSYRNLPQELPHDTTTQSLMQESPNHTTVAISQPTNANPSNAFHDRD
jgi:hypothetical protein